MADKTRIAVIGAGWWACENHIPVLKSRHEVDLVAVCTTGKKELQIVQDKFDIPYATEDYIQLIKDNDLDGVIISSPHTFHYEQAKACIEAGCHVLVEKPFTTSAAHARELVQLAKKHNVSIMVPFGYNFTNLAASALQHVKEGLLGDVRHVVLQMATSLMDLFSGEKLVGVETHLFQPKADTWSDPKKAGGYGWGQLSHALGLMFLLVDEAPDTVYAITGKSPTGVDLFDAATLKFCSGATAVLSGSAGLASQKVKAQVDLRIFGTKGHLSLDVERERVHVETVSGESFIEEVREGDGNYSCVEPVNAFVDLCLGNSEENLANGLVGCRSVEVLDAMYRSAESGKAESVFL